MSNQEKQVSKLVHKREDVYFALTALFGISTYAMLIITIIGIPIIALIFLLSMFIHSLSTAYIRRNGVKLSENQFPEIYEKAAALANRMGIKKIPSIYISESSGILNAFATRFFGKNMVVIYSEIFDLIKENGEDEMMFVLAHEFAHIKRKHVLISSLILPAMWIPFIGEAYLRACEYTCDRYAAYYTNNLGASKNALTMLAIGKKLYRDVNHDAYLQQIREESGFFAWLSEKLSTHPHLPKRINALLNWFNPEEYSLIKDNRRTQVLGLILTVTATAAIVGAGFYAAYKVDQTALFSDGYEVEGVTELMKAAEQEDMDQLEKLTSKKIDLNAKDGDGATALHYALYAGSYKSAELLLKSGANPNEKDSWGTPLVIAASYDNRKIAELLLHYGANPSTRDTDGITPLEYAQDNENKKLIDLIKSYSKKK